MVHSGAKAIDAGAKRMTILVLLVVLAAAIAIALWVTGTGEAVYANSNMSPAFFAALKFKPGQRPAAERTAAGVIVKWAADAKFTLIGGGEPYWDRFVLLAGGAPNAMPLNLGDYLEDAYIVRVKLVRPPPLAMGLFRFFILSGIWEKPAENVSIDLDAFGHRADVMPNKEQIAKLLAQPKAFAPAMVNFLEYYDQARYANAAPGRSASTGRAAYGRYGIVALQTVMRTGGRLAFYGTVEAVLRDAKTWPAGGVWNDVAVMEYRAPHSILTMEHVPAYRAALHHRDAGLARSIVIASTH